MRNSALARRPGSRQLQLSTSALKSAHRSRAVGATDPLGLAHPASVRLQDARCRSCAGKASTTPTTSLPSRNATSGLAQARLLVVADRALSTALLLRAGRGKLGLGSPGLRIRLHEREYRPSARPAALAVNLAGSTAVFLMET